MTIGQTERKFIDALSPIYGNQEAKSLAWIAIRHVCDLSRTTYLGKINEEISLAKEVSLEINRKCRIKGKPVQY